MPNKQYITVATLNFGQSLILGNTPDTLTPEMMIKKNSMTNNAIERFGLFDTAQPNYTTYYPEVTAADLNPKEADFIFPTFRMLSEVIVHKKRNPIDFSKNGVLKASMNLLVGQTINVDHEMALGNAIGAVKEVFWEPSYTTPNGVLVPAGINGKFAIDGKSNPRIARGIMMSPPSIHSNSVTVEFAWEQSHPKMEPNEFMSKIGTFGADGQLVRRIVTGVNKYHETSLVAHGADPFAQLVGSDGKINNPKYADLVYNSAEGPLKPLFFSFDFKTDTVENSATTETRPLNSNNNNPNQNNSVMFEKLKAQIAKWKGIEVSLAKEDMVEEYITHLEAEAGKVTGLDGQVTKLTGDLNTATEANKVAVAAQKTASDKVTELNATIETNKPFVTLATTILGDKRKEMTRLYNLVHEGADNTAMLAAIDKYDYATCEAQTLAYIKLADEKFPATCVACGGHEIKTSSAVRGEGAKKEGAKDKVLTLAETAASFDEVPSASLLHGDSKEYVKK